MTTTDLAIPSQHSARPRPTGGAGDLRPGSGPSGTPAPGQSTGRVSLPRVVASEWTKARSLRSTWLILLIAVVIGVGLATLTGWGTSHADASADGGFGGGPGGGGGAGDTAATVLSGTSLGALVLGLLGALNYSVWGSVADYRAAYTDPAFRAMLPQYPEGAVATPHLFTKVAVSRVGTA